MPECSREVEERLLRIARYRTRSWTQHPEYDDMLAEAHFRAWKSYQTALSRGMDHPFQIAALGAAYGPVQWLARWFGRPDRARSRLAFEHVPLQEADSVPAPSPEDEVLKRLEEAEAWERFVAGMDRCTARQRELLVRLYVRGERLGEIAAAWGISHGAATKIRARAIDHCRPGNERKRRGDRAELWSHCSKGHELSGHNRLTVHRTGRLIAVRCRECQNESRRRGRERRRTAAGARETASGLGGVR